MGQDQDVSRRDFVKAAGAVSAEIIQHYIDAQKGI
jgi:REP element-mobilizing transposase RayT